MAKVTLAQYIAKLEELARKHPDAPVVDPQGFRLALTPAECVKLARRAPRAVAPVYASPRMRDPTKGERKRGVTGKVLVTG